MRFSIIIPAHNEERHLPTCLDSIEQAAANYQNEVEIIVVLNRCTDATQRIALERGAKVVTEDSRNMARIRNAGAKRASGEIIVTIDSDSQMSKDVLCEIDRMLKTGRYVGGGADIRPERMSPGIWVTVFLIKFSFLITGLAAGLFWCLRRDFEEIGGFNENLFLAEDVDFAKRLKAHGRKRNLKFTTLPRAFIQTSCRKFDHFGDWHAFSLLLFNARSLKRALRGDDLTIPNRYYYDFNSDKQDAPTDPNNPRR